MTATATVERPILFTAPMVRAILAGRKTQTRRIVKFDAALSTDPTIKPIENEFLIEWWPVQERSFGNFGRAERIRCPYGKPGDKLWVRETWGLAGARLVDPCLNYRADESQIPVLKAIEPIPGTGYAAIQWQGPGGKTDAPGLLKIRDGWRPSIHMPRWASRITLDVTGIRVERLQAISEADAKAEGAEPFGLSGRHWRDYGLTRPGAVGSLADPRDCYASLWESINGPGAWAANPWVWVVEFARSGAGA